MAALEKQVFTITFIVPTQTSINLGTPPILFKASRISLSDLTILFTIC